MRDWLPDLTVIDKPRYLAIADAIDEDIRSGRLAPSDRLPPQRRLARKLDIDFTTVARGYVEAQRRGLIEFCAWDAGPSCAPWPNAGMERWRGIRRSSISR